MVFVMKIYSAKMTKVKELRYPLYIGTFTTTMNFLHNIKFIYKTVAKM